MRWPAAAAAPQRAAELPLLLATGPGSEIQRPLAVVVAGGLISSTALTLLLLPMLFERFGVARRAKEIHA